MRFEKKTFDRVLQYNTHYTYCRLAVSLVLL